MFELMKNSNGVIFSDQKQLVKIVPLKDGIFHIVCTQKEDFSGRQSLIVTAEEQVEAYLFEDAQEAFLMKNGEYTLEFAKNTGRILIRNGEQRVVVSETPEDGRMMTEFDSYKNIFGHETQAKTHDSVDGFRSDSDEFTKVFYKKLYKGKVQFEFMEDEAIYGFGSHEEGFGNLRGKYRYLYQQNMKACVPYFYSTNGYGCLFDANCFMIFEDNENGSYVWLDAVEELDYYFICGKSFDKVTAGYRYLTGKAPLLPKWMFGYCQSKERYKDAEELIQVVEEYRKRQVPLDVIIQDWLYWNPDTEWGQKSFDASRFPDPTGMLNKIHDLDAKLMISIWPNMRGQNQKEMLEAGCMLGNQSNYDAFSKKARDLYWKQAKEGLFKHGVDAWWCDCTEPFENDWHGTMKPQHHERVILNTEMAKKYIEEDNINAYSLVHSRGIYEGQRSVTGEKRVVNLTRSSYAGQHRYATITWAGDTAANWETLKRHIPEGVNFCASGEPYWTMDIGAFFVKKRDAWFWAGEYQEGCEDLGYRELYTRWLQYGTFLPIFRSHGTDTPREIWRFGEKGTMFYDAIEKFIRLRYQLIPYIYSLAGKITHEDYTMIRALAFDFKDEKVKKIDHQYMFGDALMVCPITRPMYYLSGSRPIEDGDKLHTVYLPKDTGWYDFWTGEYYEGGQEITKEYPIDSMPLFVKAGSILPMTKVMQYTDEEPDAPYEIRVYTGADAEFTLYDDDGDNYSYENGNYARTKISWDQEKQEVTIHEKQGDYVPKNGERCYTSNLMALAEVIPELETNIYVSVDGSDETGDGSLEKPFATIPAAQRAVRAMIQTHGLKGNAHIYLKGGTYYLAEPISIGLQDCDDNYSVIYTNYGDEVVRIVGGIPITGWADPDGDGIYEADVTGHNDFYALYADGIRQVNAREAEWRSKHVQDSSHLQVVYGGATSWFGEVLKVNDLTENSMTTVHEPGRFSGEIQYLQGAREYITQPGEWAIEGNKVYYKPEHPDSIRSSEIIAGIAANIFSVQGNADHPVKNIVISGLQLEMTGFGENLLAYGGRGEGTHEYESNLQGIVSLKHAENITVKNCCMSNAGYMAVVLAGYAQKNTIYGNEIKNTGLAGIFLIGENPGSLNYCNRENVISNNRIWNVGEFVGHGAGIYLINSGENQITHNDISNVPRYGISMKGIRYGAFYQCSIPQVPFEEHWKYNQTTKNYIGYNRIYNTGMRSGDGGGIEGWGIGRDNRIDHNIIYNAYRGIASTRWRGHSIFLDDATHYTVVTNNIVYDENAVAVNAGIFIKSICNYVVNNVFDVGYATNGAADIAPFICPAGGSTFWRNIVYSRAGGILQKDGTCTESGNGDRIMLYFDDVHNRTDTLSLDSLETMNNNLYYNAVGAAQFRVNEQLFSLEEWKVCAENRNGYDADSICEDPLFVDAEHHDYRLREDSPARKLGIESIETEEIGLLSDYRRMR